MNQMEQIKPVEEIGRIDSERELVDSWEKIMPQNVAELYLPVSKLSDLPDKQSFMTENRLDESKAVVVCAKGKYRDILRAESDVMDILVLGCIPRKIGYYELEDRSILVREYVSGESLKGAMNRIGSFSESEVRFLGEDFCVLVQELYERHLSVDSSAITAQNIIITNDGVMKFVEPEGIEYCENCDENWLETEKAIGTLMNEILTGTKKSGRKVKISSAMTGVIARSMGKRGAGYGSVSKLLRALEGTAPSVCKKRRGATIVAFAAAVLLVAIAILPIVKNINKNNSGNSSVQVGEEIPGNRLPGDVPENPDASPTPEPGEDTENK